MTIDTKIIAKSVHSILSGDRGPLWALAEHRARLERAGALVGASLPAPLNRHCRVANLSHGVLLLHVDATAWITRLRFHSPRLLDALRRHPELGIVREIQFRTAPVAERHVSPPDPRRRELPAAAAAHLRAAASTLSEPALRAALLRLAGRADRS
jgi:hypothetical protein